MPRTIYRGLITSLPENGVFVFGSNTQGIHGGGTAKIALNKYGAKWGQAKGLQGKSYAVVTKDLTKDKHPSISENTIVNQIVDLYDFAERKFGSKFYIAYTEGGLNLNGYSDREMVAMFKRAGELFGRIPKNIIFEFGFDELVYS